MGSPATQINICSGIRLNNAYDHTIYFATKNLQIEYFSGKVVKTFSGYSYIRRSWSIRVGATMEQARTWSYLYFTNPGENKTYYYFINNIEYINENTVELKVEMDVMQTYMFDYAVLNCFVEREHSSTDNIGDHVLDEGLEIGDMVVNDQINLAMGDMCLMIMTSIAIYQEVSKDNYTTNTGDIFNGVYSGMSIYAVNINNADHLQSFRNKLGAIEDAGLMDSIFKMWMYPKSLVKLLGEQTWETGGWCKFVEGITSFERYIDKNYSLNGYTPKNNKLKCYPYNLLYVSNNTGGVALYKYERFTSSNGQCRFKLTGAVTPDGVSKIYPMEYNGTESNYEEGLILSGYPSCAWSSDTYKMWLAQNENNNNLSTAMGVVSIVGGAITTGVSLASGVGMLGAGAGVGMMLSGASQIAGVMATKEDKSVQPPQARGNYSTNVNVANGKQTFTFQMKSVDYTHARAIDNYFSMYGYKCNRVKSPNICVRENWTYTKTIGCHIRGNFCTEDLTKIESIYDKGITFWTKGSNIGNYALSNKPLY